MIAYVDQITFLYNISIMVNIRVCRPDTSYDEIIETAKTVGCDDLIKALPEDQHMQADSEGGIDDGYALLFYSDNQE